MKRLIPAHVLPVAGAALIAVVGCAAQSGFLLFFVVPIVVVWAVVNIVAMRRKPEQRVLRGVNLGIWTIVLALVAGVHLYRVQATRHYADAVVTRVENWQAANGRWPRTLADIDAEPDSRPPRVLYGLGDDGPFLVYRSTFAPFDAHIYDFPSRQWHYHAD